MSLLYRLRRSVALFICPEMGVEARLKAARLCSGAAQAVPVSFPVAAGEPAEPSDQKGSVTEPRPWEGLHDQEAAQAYLAAASEAELRAMAEHLLADRPLSHAEVVLQQRILLAANASEKLSRRLIWARAEGPRPEQKMRFQGSDRGDRA